MTKQQIIDSFDPSQPGLADATVFGLPFSAEQSEIVIIPVPWEVTVSYGAGASEGPEAVLDASFQVDLNHQDFPELWKLGIYLDEAPSHWKDNSDQYKALAQPIIELLESGEAVENHPALQCQTRPAANRCSGTSGPCRRIELSLYSAGPRNRSTIRWPTAPM